MSGRKSRQPHRGHAVVRAENIELSIIVLRGERVILDADLARLYAVPTKRLNEQVRRNRRRFPTDFMFRLTREEFSHLRSQSATSSSRWGGRRHNPHAFTEHGAIMAANVLSSERALEASVLVVRAFVRLRQFLMSHAELARKLAELEKRYDAEFRAVFDAIRALMEPVVSSTKPRIGFRPSTTERGGSDIAQTEEIARARMLGTAFRRPRGSRNPD